MHVWTLSSIDHVDLMYSFIALNIKRIIIEWLWKKSVNKTHNTLINKWLFSHVLGQAPQERRLQWVEFRSQVVLQLEHCARVSHLNGHHQWLQQQEELVAEDARRLIRRCSGRRLRGLPCVLLKHERQRRTRPGQECWSFPSSAAIILQTKTYWRIIRQISLIWWKGLKRFCK